MSKTIACVIARTTSSRLPLKVLRLVNDEYRMIDFILQRLKKVSNINDIYLCTSDDPVDDIMEDIALVNGVKLYRGSAESVIDRLVAVADLEYADNIIRITGDNVFTSIEHLQRQIEIHNDEQLDYTRIIGVPLGATAEVIKSTALKHCYDRIDKAISEYLLLYLFCPEIYVCGVITLNDLKDSSNYSVTVDTPLDLIRTREIIKLYCNNPLDITLKEILAIIDDNGLSETVISSTDLVKMPYGVEITFASFQENMCDRQSASKQFSLGN
jgi:spore coat polysaccharide biosynthesis protein SpsF